jgi:hypothetical protein
MASEPSFFLPYEFAPATWKGNRRIDAVGSQINRFFAKFRPADAAALPPWIRVRKSFFHSLPKLPFEFLIPGNSLKKELSLFRLNPHLSSRGANLFPLSIRLNSQTVVYY